MRRLALAALLVASFARGARAEGPAPSPLPPGPAPAAWEPPARFLSAWLRAGPFLARDLPGSRASPELAMGLGLRPLSFLSLEAEGGWISRDLDVGGARQTLASRAATLGVRFHHLWGSFEPSVFAGVALLDNQLSSGVSLGSSRTTGLSLGAALDLALGETFSLGVEGRWLQGGSLARAGQPALSLDGIAVTAAVRVYYP